VIAFDYEAVTIRIRQMRKNAAKFGKVVPSKEDMLVLFSECIQSGFKCPACSRVMNWFFKDGRSTVVTLQHDRDGTIRLLCKGCNSAHARHQGDSFYDIPKGHKLCRICKAIKLLTDFYKDAHKSTGIASGCKKCLNKKSCERSKSDKAKATARAWQKANREYLTERQRLRRRGVAS